jgi:hypothetical protein
VEAGSIYVCIERLCRGRGWCYIWAPAEGGGIGPIAASLGSDVGCLRNFVSSKFRIFRIFFLISYTTRKWQQFRENNRNFAVTGVRIDSVQIYQFSIAKIMTFFLDTSVNVV